MAHRACLGCLAALLIVGCGHDAPLAHHLPAREPAVKPAATPESATVNSIQESPSGKQARLSVGPISFDPPVGWEARQESEPPGTRVFAPERPELKGIGFRPNLGVLVRPHPGVSLDRFCEMLNQTLAQGADRTNATIREHSRATGNRHLPDDPIKEIGKYSLHVTTVDGARVLSTTFAGVLKVPTGLIATKTYGMQFLDSDALYSISLTFPAELEKHMTAVWAIFVEGVRINKSYRRTVQ
jgi:hypothetical protein